MLHPENIDHEFGHVIQAVFDRPADRDQKSAFLNLFVNYSDEDIIGGPRDFRRGYSCPSDGEHCSCSIQSSDPYMAEEWADNYMNLVNRTFSIDTYGNQRRNAVSYIVGIYR
jgi:hypothetical protein